MSSLHSKTLFASFAVMAIVAAAFAGISVLGDDSDAMNNGSLQNPLTSLIGDAVSYADETYYVAVGSIVNIGVDSEGMMGCDDVTSGFGLSLSDETVSGTISKSGTILIHTTDSNSDTHTITIIAVDSSEDPIDFTSPAAVDSVSGSSIKYQATTNITGTTFAATGTGNASWLTITSAGLLSGTAPSVSQKTSYTYSIQATSPGGQTVVQKVTFDVYPVAQLKATSSTITGTVGSAISSVTVSSNIACTLTLQDSSKLTDLGLSFNSSTGVISGTPTKTGSAVVKILGSTTVGPAQTPSIEISVSVGEAALQITSEPPTGVFAVGKNYTYDLTANQDVEWSISGAPSWLSLSGSKVVGQVTGITEAGTIRVR